MGEKIKQSKKGSIGRKSIPYRIHVKRIRTMGISAALAGILATSMIVGTSNTISKINNQSSVDSSLRQMIVKDKKYGSILDKYTYRVGNGEHYAYNLSKVADDLVKCSPDDFDVILFSIYNDMQYKSNNLEDLFSCINVSVSRIEEENPELYYRMKDINSFDDYLRKLNLVDKDGTPSVDKYIKYGAYMNKLQKDAFKQEADRIKSEEKSNGKRY